MKSKIFLTEEGKKEIEAKIISLNKEYKKEQESSIPLEAILHGIRSVIYIYKEILASATILPIEESWNECISATSEYNRIQDLKKIYSNGVIIQPKQ